MGARYLIAAVTGAAYGALCVLLGSGPFTFQVMVPTALVLALILEAMAAHIDAKGGKPELYHETGLRTASVLALLCAFLGLGVRQTFGSYSEFLPALFLFPLFLWMWRDRWHPSDETPPLIKKFGSENLLAKLMGALAGAGLIVGLFTPPKHFLGVVAWMVLGAAVAGLIWMDADETLRRKA